MARLSRRHLGAGLLASAGLILPIGPVFAQGRVEIPSGTMLLSRRIVRELRDGNLLTVDRSWHINFASQGRGLAISGVQIGATVDAPAKISALAKIEEARSTASMWPILLSSSGRILATGEYATTEDVQVMIDAALRFTEDRGDSEPKMKQHRQALSQLRQVNASLLEHIPPDLFYPRDDGHQINRVVSLPDGSEGELKVDYVVSKAAGKQWLSHAERKITTRIGPDERRSSDGWFLRPI